MVADMEAFDLSSGQVTGRDGVFGFQGGYKHFNPSLDVGRYTYHGRLYLLAVVPRDVT